MSQTEGSYFFVKYLLLYISESVMRITTRPFLYEIEFLDFFFFNKFWKYLYGNEVGL